VADDIWYEGEPNDFEEKALNLLILDGEFGLNDLDEDEQLRYICEYRIGEEGEEEEGSEEEEESEEQEASGGEEGRRFSGRLGIPNLSILSL
jgi:hypothetical protein